MNDHSSIYISVSLKRPWSLPEGGSESSSSPLWFQVPCDCEGVNSAGWLENNAPCSWNPGKGWLYPRAQPSQASFKLLDLLSILLILKENKLHKWDRWFLFVMTVAILSSPAALSPSSLSAFLEHLPVLVFFFLFWNGQVAQHGRHLNMDTRLCITSGWMKLWWPLWPTNVRQAEVLTSFI